MQHQRQGVPFTDMLGELLDFVKKETSTPTLVAHGGYLNDFPLLFANCMKHNIDIATVFENYTFIVTVKVLNEWGGCKKPGLQSIANADYNHHNALADAEMLMNVYT